jgi:hypothetical protein
LQKEEVDLSLLADEMILCVENIKASIKGQLEVIKKLIKIFVAENKTE